MLMPLKDLYLGVKWSELSLSNWVKPLIDRKKFKLTYKGEG